MSYTGQFLQTIYPPTPGGFFYWGYSKDMKLNEEGEYATDHNRLKLYAEWRRYWDVSKPILIEKSPRHMLMTRLLQYYFTPERSYFVVVMRHPYGTVREIMNGRYQSFYRDCGAEAIAHWLMIYEALFEDLKHIRNRVVLHLEKFVEGDTQGME